MGRFLLVRVAFAIALVVVSSSSALLLTRLAPGDATAHVDPFASARQAAVTRSRYQLDRSPAGQWRVWAGRAVRLDFGDSSLYGRPVAPLVAAAALNTALLGGTALIVATVLGIGLGLVSGSRRGWPTMLVSGFSVACLSLPPLLTTLVLVFIASRTGWLPSGGMTSVQRLGASGWLWVRDVAHHLVLPVVALALPLAASLERLQSRALAASLHQPFVIAAAARGASPLRQVLRHAWPASLPGICGVYGVAIGMLLSGSFVVEYIVAWPGLGRLLYEALRARDVYLVSGCAAAGAAVLAIGTLLADVLLAIADPRVREGAAG